MKRFLLTAATVVSFAGVAHAADFEFNDPYAIVSSMMANSGAAFMTIVNTTDRDDRVIAAHADVAERVELHTHISDANGVMRMVKVEEGFPVPAHGTRELKRGGDHVMFLGLKGPLEDGTVVPVTLTFENAGDVVVDVPVDLSRNRPMRMMNGAKPGMGMRMPAN